MNRILTTYLLLITSFIFSQDSIGIKVDSITKEKKIVKLDSIINKQLKVKDTIFLEFKSNELTIPINEDNLTKVVMIKGESKVDWLKYLLPIFTLILGIVIKGVIERLSNKKKIKKSGERWIAELRSLEEPINKQIESLNEFLKENEKKEFKRPELVFYSSLNGEVFKSLDKNDLIKYIENNNKGDDFKDIVKISNKTHGYINVLVHLHESLKDKFDKFLSGISLHTTSFTKNVQSFNSAYVDYGIAIEKENNNSMQDERYKPIFDLYSKYIVPHLDDGNYNVFLLEKDFFIPVIKILSNYRFDEKTKPLSIATTSCLNDIKGIIMEKKYMSENINSLIKQYKKINEILNEIINGIEKH